MSLSYCLQVTIKLTNTFSLVGMYLSYLYKSLITNLPEKREGGIGEGGIGGEGLEREWCEGTILCFSQI